MKEKLNVFLFTVALLLSFGCNSVDRSNPSELRNKAREYDNMAKELRQLADKLENKTKITGTEAPQIAVTYYPYEESQYRSAGGPFPNYSSWTDDRMKKDLLRMATGGIDLVLVKASIEKIREAMVSERYIRFLQISASDPSYPKVALFADCTNATRHDINLFVSWCSMQDLGLNKSYYKEEKQPILVLINAQKHHGISHPALNLKTAGKNGDWNWTKNPLNQPIIPINGDKQTMIYASFNSPDHPENWLIDRKNGKHLLSTFRKAISNGRNLIIIESWNNYRNGSFIEPNTRDQFTLYQLLQNEIQRINL